MASQRLEAAFWNVFAFCYDSIARLIPYQETMNDLVSAMDLRPGVRILDAGCGTGNLEKAILKANIPVHVEAVDFSEAMLRRAQKKNRWAGVSFSRADLNEPLPFADATFDIVVANNVFFALPNVEEVLQEVRRVLKPNSRLVISDPKEGSNVFAVFWRHLWGGGFFRALGRAAILIGAVVVIPELLIVAVAQIIIELKGHNKRYHFRSSEEWEALVKALTMSSTYADQNWLLVVEGERLVAGIPSC